MSINAHATYFGQAVTEGTSQVTTIATGDCNSDNYSGQTNPAGMTGGHSLNLPKENKSWLRPTSHAWEQSPEPESDEFRASLIAKMDSLIQDFRMEKTTRMETLYQILQVLHDANINEPARCATLEEYTLYVNLIAMQQAEAEYWGLGTRAAQAHQESGNRDWGGEDHTRNSHTSEAKKFLQGLQKELHQKRH